MRKREQFKLTDIVTQLEEGEALIEKLHPVQYPAGSVDPQYSYRLFFRSNRAYRNKWNREWFFMTIWLGGGRPGFLRDFKMTYDLKRDIPLKEFYDIIDQYVVMLKLQNWRYLDTNSQRFGSLLMHDIGLIYDTRDDKRGYYPSTGLIFMQSYEARLR